MDFLRFWNLERSPFELGTDPDFFFESRAHGEALARLMYLISDPGMNLGGLTGEIGSGKTITLRALLQKIPRTKYLPLLLPNSGFNLDQILAEVVARITEEPGVRPVGNRYEVSREFEQAVEGLLSQGRRLVLLLDEAQGMAPEVLEDLRFITNLFPDRGGAVTLILAGLPELGEKLQRLPQIHQRIGIFFRLKYLDQDEIAAYLEYRLGVAGAARLNAFDPECVEALFTYSGGCPRLLNKVCKLAVDRACLLEQEVVDSRMIELIVADLQHQMA